GGQQQREHERADPARAQHHPEKGGFARRRRPSRGRVDGQSRSRSPLVSCRMARSTILSTVSRESSESESAVAASTSAISSSSMGSGAFFFRSRRLLGPDRRIIAPIFSEFAAR